MTTGARQPTVLVTGGRGRLGSLLVGSLRADGVRVCSLGRSGAGAAQHPDDAAADLRDPDAVSRVIVQSEPDVVVHLASVLHGRDLAADNRQIDVAVADGIRASQTRHVVVASSGAVYGTARADALGEDAPADGRSEYALSKLRTEEHFHELTRAEPALSVTALRIFNIAGSRFPDSLVLRLLRATAIEPLAVVAPDLFVRDYIHQDDVVAVLRAAIAHPETGFRVLNVGAGVPVSTAMLLDRLDIPESCVVEQAGEASTNWADISRLTAVLGVTPRAMPDRSWADARESDAIRVTGPSERMG